MEQLTDLPVIVWAGAGVGLIVVLVPILWFRSWLRRRRQLVTVEARLVTKRTSTTGLLSARAGNQVYTYYFATFEMHNGERREFPLRDQDFGLLVEGDEGTLTFQGTRWHGFERKLPMRTTKTKRRLRRA
ncbi:MAG: DUF2500 domain-containing protein [Gemmataceae bacterium]